MYVNIDTKYRKVLMGSIYIARTIVIELSYIMNMCVECGVTENEK